MTSHWRHKVTSLSDMKSTVYNLTSDVSVTLSDIELTPNLHITFVWCSGRCVQCFAFLRSRLVEIFASDSCVAEWEVGGGGGQLYARRASWVAPTPSACRVKTQHFLTKHAFLVQFYLRIPKCYLFLRTTIRNVENPLPKSDVITFACFIFTIA